MQALDAAEISWIPSHYRVCRLMVRRRSPPRLRIPEEYLYFPTSLKQICAVAIIRNNKDTKNLPEELITFIQNLRDENAHPFEMKARTCGQEDLGGAINVGNFLNYPDVLMNPQPTPGKMFATDLISQASSVVKFLSYLNAHSALQSHSVMTRALLKRYPAFLAMQCDSYPTVLSPPDDVALVWFCHMLQSLQYENFMKEISNGKLSSLSHPCVRLWSAEEISKAEEETKLRWQKLSAADPLLGEFDTLCESLSESVLKSLLSSVGEMYMNLPTTEDVLADQLWIKQFLLSTQSIGGSDFGTEKHQRFLKRSLLGYQKYMFLLAKSTRRVEQNGFSPCPPIDLMWHTHLVQPAEYRRFCRETIFQVHHHKLLPMSERTAMTYERSEDAEAMWKETFGESQSFYLSPLHDPRRTLLAVTCDHCSKEILNCVRFHCAICTDFDLCEKCQHETPAMHLRTHTMFRLMSKDLIKF